MVVYPLTIARGHAAPKPFLQWRPCSSVCEAIFMLATIYRGKIADRVSDRRGRAGSFLGPLDGRAVTQSDQKKPGTVLWNAKIEGSQDPGIDFVTECTQ
jgi:hypothetical protein